MLRFYLSLQNEKKWINALMLWGFHCWIDTGGTLLKYVWCSVNLWSPRLKIGLCVPPPLNEEIQFSTRHTPCCLATSNESSNLMKGATHERTAPPTPGLAEPSGNWRKSNEIGHDHIKHSRLTDKKKGNKYINKLSKHSLKTQSGEELSCNGKWWNDPQQRWKLAFEVKTELGTLSCKK